MAQTKTVSLNRRIFSGSTEGLARLLPSSRAEAFGADSTDETAKRGRKLREWPAGKRFDYGELSEQCRSAAEELDRTASENAACITRTGLLSTLVRHAEINVSSHDIVAGPRQIIGRGMPCHLGPLGSEAVLDRRGQFAAAAQ